MSVYDKILTAFHSTQPLLFILIDPDKVEQKSLSDFVTNSDIAGVDGYLVGGSLSLVAHLDDIIQVVKKVTSKPVIIFPGGVHHITGTADAILFISMISGRNADHLIGQHVIAAPIVKQLQLEAISTGYMLIESGKTTTAEFMSNSKPIPRHKPEIAAAHALAAEYLGMKLVYLEAGSGADQSVPDEMISFVAKMINIPLIVGGGIRTPEMAYQKVKAGASIIVIGNHFEDSRNHIQIKTFVDAVHSGSFPKDRSDTHMITV